MKRRIYKFNQLAFHIISHCNQKFWPCPSKNKAWSLLLEELKLLSDRRVLKIYALVMMSNHLHMLCSFESSGDIDLSFSEGSFFNEKIEQFEIRNIKQYRATYKYILRNPVEAKLVEKVELYPFTSLSILRGDWSALKSAGFVDQMNFVSNPVVLLKWLNQKDIKLENFNDYYQLTSRSP